jgi:hypothetical protein
VKNRDGRVLTDVIKTSSEASQLGEPRNFLLFPEKSTATWKCVRNRREIGIVVCWLFGLEACRLLRLFAQPVL